MKTIKAVQTNHPAENAVQVWDLKNRIGQTAVIHGSVSRIRKMRG